MVDSNQLFDPRIGAGCAAREADASHPAALNASDCMCHSISCHLEVRQKPRGKIGADEARILEAKEREIADAVPKTRQLYLEFWREREGFTLRLTDVKVRTLLAGTVKKVKKGSIAYTDRWKGHDSLMFHGYHHLSADHSKMFGKGDVCINGTEGFWSFAKERTAKHHGVGSERFLLHIKEREWRCNNRDEDTFSLLPDYVLVVND